MADLDLTEAVELAWDESLSERTVVEYSDSGNDEGMWSLVERVVNVAATHIAAQVRAQVAEEIEAAREDIDRYPSTRAGDLAFGKDVGLEQAAKIARGESA